MFKTVSFYVIILYLMRISSATESHEIISEEYVSKYNSVINRVMIQLLQNCFHDYDTLVVCDDHGTLLRQSLFGVPSKSFIVHETGEQEVEKKTSVFKTVNAFIMSTNSSEDLAETLSSIKVTSYWSIKSTFFILSNSSDGKCSEASDILQTAWDKNLISVYYICLIDPEEPVIYTFNPYTSRAPKVWQLSMITTRRNNRWTLFSQKYNEGKICNDFEFNRLKYFDGANLSMVSCSDFILLYSFLLKDVGSTVARTMSEVLNFSLVSIQADSAFDMTPEPEGFYLHLLNSSVYFTDCLRPHVYRYNFSISYPVVRTSVSIISHHRGYYTPLEKISKFYGTWVLVFTLIIVIILYWVILVSKGGRRFSFAAFEILRFFTNLGFLTPMNTLPKRIFFCVILIYSLILQATFQGKLSTFLTNIESRKNVETMNDLKDSRIERIFASPSSTRVLSDIPSLQGKTKMVDAITCVEKLLEEKTAVCVNLQFVVLRRVISHKLHLSRKLIAEQQLYMMVGPDNPLEERVDEFLMRLEQTGLTKVWSEQIVQEQLMLLKMIEERAIIKFRPIALKDIAFAFYFLMIGLAIAGIVFILEQLFNRYQKLVFGFTFQLY